MEPLKGIEKKNPKNGEISPFDDVSNTPSSNVDKKWNLRKKDIHERNYT